MENAAFWNVTACSLLIQTNVLEEVPTSISKVWNEAGGYISSNLLVPVYQTTWHPIPEGSNFHIISNSQSMKEI